MASPRKSQPTATFNLATWMKKSTTASGVPLKVQHAATLAKAAKLAASILKRATS